MFSVIVLVLNDPDRCAEILDAWEAAGVRGATILESSGLGRLRQAAIMDNLPLLPTIGDLFRGEETRHRTLFTVIRNEQIDPIVEATQSVVGDLEKENTGLLFVAPLTHVFGRNRIFPGNDGE